jgi:hypothetical protein
MRKHLDLATTRNLSFAIIYDSANARAWAERFGKQFAAEHPPGRSHEVTLCEFRVLGRRGVRNAMASKAAEADAVIVSTDGTDPLPVCVENWIAMWIWVTDRHQPTLILLLSVENSESRRICSYLQKAAASKALPFIAQTHSAPPATPRLRAFGMRPANESSAGSASATAQILNL